MADRADKSKKAEFGPSYTVKVRPGSKAGWWEMVVTKGDGTEVKMIGRKVNRFWSEKEEPSEL